MTSDRVKELRAGGKPSPLLELAHWGMGIAGLVVILLIALFFVRRRRRH
ncbi:LPXTG cell wall anchor domain-containing protein [Rahnella sp. 2050]